MWNLPCYLSRKRIFKNLFQNSLEVIGARTSRTILRIYCKFLFVYLKTGDAVARIIAIGKFAFRDLASWLDNFFSNLEDGKKLRRATKEHSL